MKNKDKLKTLNKFKVKHNVIPDRSYFLQEEKSCKQFVEFFINLLIQTPQESALIKEELLNIKNNLNKDDFNLYLKFRKLIDLLRAECFNVHAVKYNTNLLVALSSLDEINDFYKIFPKPNDHSNNE